MKNGCPTIVGLIAVSAVLFPGCTLSAQETRASFTPAVDYHQHLASPAGVALLNRSLPAIKVPTPLEDVLTRMSAGWNDSVALASLYSDDAVVVANFGDRHRGFVTGPRAAGAYLSTLYGRTYRATPVFYSGDERTARIAGYFTRGDGAKARTFAYFYFDLARQPDASWKIKGDSRTFEPKPYYQDTISGSQLLSMLDSARIRKAVVLSDAYWFDSPEYAWIGRTPAEEYAQVRAENDWTAAQAAASGGRLVAFCSFNPLADHAIAELKRCKSSGQFAGVKLHLQMSGVDLLEASHVVKLRAVFSNANKLRLPIIVHAQTKKNYGKEAAQIFIDSILPAAPDIPVTIAHLWGGGPFNGDALAVYIAAVVNHRPATHNLFFDLAEAALVANRDPERVAAIANAIRQVGPDRILFGSDAVGQYTLPPARAAAQFHADIPLSDAEFSAIAKNVLPYVHN